MTTKPKPGKTLYKALMDQLHQPSPTREPNRAETAASVRSASEDLPGYSFGKNRASMSVNLFES